VIGRWVEVADGVLARRYGELDLTVGLVVGNGACLVVDTRGDAVQGAEFAAAIRTVTKAPWQVAITHAHFDHCFGTAAFLPARVWAHRRCAADLAATGERQRAHWARHYAEQDQPQVAEALLAAPLVLPDQLLDDRIDLDIGGRRVVLAHLGLGHTDHDVVVWLPDDGVVFAGDLVEQGAPPAFEDAYPLTWPSTVDALLRLGAAVVVPGHGDPVGEAFVRAQRQELATIATLCHRHLAGEPAATLGGSPYPAETTRTALSRASSLASSQERLGPERNVTFR
jgi:glyoxylase-like metal-dependent hydrolase (beta-lactamase superfamily II)